MCCKILGIFLCIIAYSKGAIDYNVGSQASFTEGVIRRELERFALNEASFEKLNVNITLILSHSRTNADGNITETDSFGLVPITYKGNPNAPKLPDHLEDQNMFQILNTSDAMNYSAAASRERFSKDGSLKSKTVYANHVKVRYEDGHSELVIADEIDEEENQEDVDEFLDSIMKELQLPVELYKSLYNSTGDVIKSIYTDFRPIKVKISKSAKMPVAKQLKVAEALKRVNEMKKHTQERLELLIKFLNIQYPTSNWQVVVGGQNHFLNSVEWVQLRYDRRTYTIFASR